MNRREALERYGRDDDVSGGRKSTAMLAEWAARDEDPFEGRADFSPLVNIVAAAPKRTCVCAPRGNFFCETHGVIQSDRTGKEP